MIHILCQMNNSKNMHCQFSFQKFTDVMTASVALTRSNAKITSVLVHDKECVWLEIARLHFLFDRPYTSIHKNKNKFSVCTVCVR